MEIIKWIRANSIHVIMYIIAITVILWLLSYRPHDKSDNIIREAKRIEKLYKDSLDIVNNNIKVLEDSIACHKKKIDSSSMIIKSLESNIKQNKIDYETAISHLDTFSISDLQKYFTERYSE